MCLRFAVVDHHSEGLLTRTALHGVEGQQNAVLVSLYTLLTILSCLVLPDQHFELQPGKHSIALKEAESRRQVTSDKLTDARLAENFLVSKTP
jgi:hypothetical protein